VYFCAGRLTVMRPLHNASMSRLAFLLVGFADAMGELSSEQVRRIEVAFNSFDNASVALVCQYLYQYNMLSGI
jgi:hypothetical protein